MEITLRGEFAALAAALTGEGLSSREVGGMLIVLVEGADTLTSVLRRALEAGLSVEQVVPRHETLEDLFMREAITEGDTAPQGDAA